MNKILQQHYESTLEKHGPCAQGMDWPNEDDLNARFKVMLEVIGSNPHNTISILDLGCGIGLLKKYIEDNREPPDEYGQYVHTTDRINFWYFGIDISQKMIDEAQKQEWMPGRGPGGKTYECKQQDILQEPLQPESHDYVIMNGLFTEKLTMSHEEMFAFFKQMIFAAFDACRYGIAFNVMTKHLDWERDDLFHLGFDDLAAFLTKEISKNFVIRADYGLREYACYVYKEDHRDNILRRLG